MLLLKSFFRAKTTRIYLIIMCLVFSLFFIVNNSRNYYSNIIDDYYEGERIIIEADLSEYAKIKKLPNIKKVTPALKIQTITWPAQYLIKDETNQLKENEIIISKAHKNTYQINDSVNFYLGNISYSFNLKEYSTIDKHTYQISDIDFNKLINNQKLVYLIEVEEYQSQAITIKAIENNINYLDECILLQNFKEQNQNLTIFETYYNILTIIIYILAIAFIAIIIIALCNIIIDEKKKNTLYFFLGYSKKCLRKQNIFKLIILLVSAFAISFIISFIIILLLGV
ncbi:MAG: hypothetical protein HFI36_01460 [Bacilli bacterium]|jgi:hypothetical protein|nr:hypothetical protein [Bacilli bacterium]MCX4254090.1 hypothetical protein [Bacilli bacterium]